MRRGVSSVNVLTKLMIGAGHKNTNFNEQNMNVYHISAASGLLTQISARENTHPDMFFAVSQSLQMQSSTLI
jgi:hypothetical protein